MSRESTVVPNVLTKLTWALFGAAVGVAVWSPDPEVLSGGGFRVDGLTQVMAVVVTFVSGVVQSFSRRYMAGARRIGRFYAQLVVLTLVVLLLTAANHLLLFLGLWTAMGWMLSRLIGHVQGWPQARASARIARRYFFGGSALLAGAIALLVQQTGAWTFAGLTELIGGVSAPVLVAASVLILLAAMVQSALVPFHGWLLSSMTAPTPVSAFMHAGLVNAGGILLARFAVVVFGLPEFMLVMVAAGALTALIAQAWMMVQTDVKRSLGCSTVAQMGFMVLQCGLGFVPAAITHLILHGFYKAYLFLGSGSVVEHKRPEPESSPASAGVRGLSAVVALATGAAGGVLFATLTGKSLTALGSGALLVFFVVMAVLHATQTIIRRTRLSAVARLLAVPAAVLPAIGLYALVYEGVKVVMTGVPMAVMPVSLSAGHGVIAVLFLLAYAAMEMGWHRLSPRLYVLLLNSSQPLSETILTRRDQYQTY